MSHALIIEDEFLIAVELKEALEGLGYITVDVAASKQQAIAAAERQCPDLILADYMIIGGTGLDAINAICSQAPIPVVFVTANAALVREQLPEPVVIDKPFFIKPLAAAIGQAIDRPFQSLAGRADGD